LVVAGLAIHAGHVDGGDAWRVGSLFSQEMVGEPQRTTTAAILTVGMGLGWASSAALGGLLLEVVDFRALFLLAGRWHRRRPRGRSLDQWLLAMLLFFAMPRRLAWQPMGCRQRRIHQFKQAILTQAQVVVERLTEVAEPLPSIGFQHTPSLTDFSLNRKTS
jgi:hypothetical protein